MRIFIILLFTIFISSEQLKLIGVFIFPKYIDKNKIQSVYDYNDTCKIIMQNKQEFLSEYNCDELVKILEN